MTVDDYIGQFHSDVRERLETVRRTIRELAPDAEESMAYGMPAYKLRGKPLVYFAGYKNHIGFYATPNGHEVLKTEFAKYKQGKGSVQFPLDRLLPIDLVRRVVRFRIEQITK